HLTPRILELGFTYLSTLSLRDIARPIVDDFARETGQVCTVSVLDGRDVVYVVRAELRSPLARQLSVGERLPAHATASGQIMLGDISDDELDAFLSEPLARFTPKTK